MTPKPPHLNVPMLVKRYKIEVSSYKGDWSALLWHLGCPYTSTGHPSKRKAVLSVLQQAGIEIK